MAAGAVVLLLASGVPSSEAQTGPPPTGHTLVASDLDNPRGIDVGPRGTVFVAESGAGGATMADGSVEGEPGKVCVGTTGGVTALLGDYQLRVATLPSVAAAVAGPGGVLTCTGAGSEATGPADVAVRAGRIAVTMGLGGPPEVRDGLPAELRDQFGTVRLLRGSTTVALADLAAYEKTANPVNEVDSNPYGLAALPNGYVVADAGGNDLLQVTPNGTATATVRTIATFPDSAPAPFVPPSCGGALPPGTFPPAGTPIPAQAVPTTVEVGSNGTYYVGFLTGFPFREGASRIVRVSPTGRTSVMATGLTQVVGLDIADDGALYAVELSTRSLLEGACGRPAPGDVVRFFHGKRSVVASGLPAPGGVAVAPDGSFYVTVNSTSPGSGEVWHFGAPRGASGKG